LAFYEVKYKQHREHMLTKMKYIMKRIDFQLSLLIFNFCVVIAPYCHGYSEAFVEVYNSACYKINNGAYQDAIALLDEGLGMGEDNPLILMTRGRVFAIKGKYDAAAADFSTVIEKDCLDPLAYIYRGEVLSKLEQYERAVADFEKAIELDKDTALKNEVYGKMGIVQDQLGHSDEAVMSLTRQIEASGGQIGDYLNRGFVRRRTGDLSGACADFKKVIELDPGNVACMNDLALLYEQQRLFEPAIEIYNKAIETSPAKESLQYRRGMCRFQLQKFISAKHDFEQSLRSGEEYKTAHIWSGLCSLFLGNKREAISCLNRWDSCRNDVSLNFADVLLLFLGASKDDPSWLSQDSWKTDECFAPVIKYLIGDLNRAQILEETSFKPESKALVFWIWGLEEEKNGNYLGSLRYYLESVFFEKPGTGLYNLLLVQIKQTAVNG